MCDEPDKTLCSLPVPFLTTLQGGGRDLLAESFLKEEKVCQTEGNAVINNLTLWGSREQGMCI